MIVLLITLLFLSAAGCSREPSPSGKAGTLRFFDIINLDVRDVPMLMAFDALETQGYTVEKTYMSSSALIADALARGDADLGMLNNQTMWIAITKGAQVRTIAQFTAPATVLAAKREIASCSDLDNKKIAVATTRGLSPALLDLYLKQKCSGVTPQFLVILESTGRAAALMSGEVDATVLPQEELLKLQRETPDRFHVIMSPAEEFPDIQIDGLHIRRQWAEQNPQLIKDFLRALLNAYRQIKANPHLLFDESVKRLSIDPESAKAIGEAHLRAGIWDSNGGLTQQNIQHTIDFLTNIDALPKGLKVEDVADLSYLKSVLDEIGRQ